MKTFLSLLVVILPLTVGLALAQQNTPVPPATLNGVNEVDLSTPVTIPIFPKSGRGLHMNFNAVLYPVYWGVYINGNGQAIWGTSSGVTFLPTLGAAPSHLYNQRAGLCNGQMMVEQAMFHWRDPQGIDHGFPGDVFERGAPCGQPTIAQGYATDLSGYYMYWDADGICATPCGITYPDGTFLGMPTGGNPGTLTDSNGNQIIPAYNSGTGTWTYTDTLGVPALTMTGTAGGPGCSGCAPPNPAVYTYHGPSGDRSVTINYSGILLASNFQCPNVYEMDTTGEHPLYLPSSVVYPDGSEYLFTYEPTPGKSGYSTGRLATITLPTGGVVSYTYGGAHDGEICTSQGWPGGFASALSSTLEGGTWSYSREANINAPIVTTITGPNGQKKVDTFAAWQNSVPPQGGLTWLRVQSKLYDGSALVYTEDICYDGNTAPCTSIGAITSRLSSTTTATVGSNVAKVSSTFLNNTLLPATIASYDFGLTLNNTKTITYGSWNGTGCTALGNNIVVLPCETLVTDGGGSTVSDERFSYDETSVTSTSGTPNQVAITGSRGNQTSESHWLSGTNWLSTHAAYYDTGLVNSVTDLNGAATSFTYSACGNSLKTSDSFPLSLSTSVTWEAACNGVVPMSVTDFNGKVANGYYADSSFWRLTSLADPLGNTTSISYLYSGSTPVGTETSFTYNGGASVRDKRTNTDAYGRVFVSQIEKGPSSSQYDSVETDFDISGRVSSVTVPYQGTARTTNPTAPRTVAQYDGAGRRRLVTDGGGGTTTYCFYPSTGGGCSGSTTNDVLITLGPAPTGEVVKKKQFEYDAFGRITSVCELSTSSGSGTCGQTVAQTGFWTKYSYDVMGRIMSITQNAQGVSQIRTFTYDAAGRKLTESHPESRLFSFFYDTAPSTPGVACTNSTFVGDLVKVYDADGNTICKEYDLLHRVTAIRPMGGPNKAATKDVHFVYDAAAVNGVTMQNAAGRLAEAFTSNSGNLTAIIDMGFSYDARGDVVNLYEKTANSSNYKTFTYTYDGAGQLSTMASTLAGFPTLTFAANGQGQLNQITSTDPSNSTFLYNTVYNNAGLPTEVDLTSTTNKDTFVYDPNTNRWESGTYPTGIVVNPVWNANGTVQSNTITDPNNAANGQTCTYLQDELARLSSALCTGTVKWGASYTYDPFGNVTKSVPSGYTGTTWTPGYIQTTNRVIGSTYDSNGSLLTDGFHTYTWNSNDQLATVDTLKRWFDSFGTLAEVQLSGGGWHQYYYTPAGLVVGSSTNLAWAYIDLPGGAKAFYTKGGPLAFMHADWRSNLVAQTSGTGTYVGSQAYAPFGENYAVSGMSNFFMGLTSDIASGETDAGAREMQWASGRFIEPDPSRTFQVDNPQSLNLYAYVGNSPMEKLDPSGLTETAAEIEKRLERGESAFGGFWGETGTEYAERTAFNPGGRYYVAGPDGTRVIGRDMQEDVQHGPALPHPSVEGTTVQLVKDTLIGSSKETANTLIGLANTVNRPIDEMLSHFTNFRFGQLSEYKGSTPGEKSAMAGVFIVSFFTGVGEEKAAVKAGPMIEHVFSNPKVLENFLSESHATALGDLLKSLGWDVGALRKGSHAGQGMHALEVNAEGKLTGRAISWHPGGGHHGPGAYWKVSSPGGGTVRVGTQFPQ